MKRQSNSSFFCNPKNNKISKTENNKYLLEQSKYQELSYIQTDPVLCDDDLDEKPEVNMQILLQFVAIGLLPMIVLILHAFLGEKANERDFARAPESSPFN